jgi:uncharacterized protein YndB with AHSA1/START domain
MKQVLRKAILGSALFLVIIIVTSFIIDSDWEVSYPITITASPAIVWEVLTDLERYPEWNRYSPNVSGQIAVGEVVWVEAHLDNEIQHVQNFVLSIKPQQELCWQSADWYGFLARGTRCRWLSVTDSGTTLMVHHEVMRGPLAWLIEWIYRDRIERGLQLVNESVANRAESIAVRPL